MTVEYKKEHPVVCDLTEEELHNFRETFRTIDYLNAACEEREYTAKQVKPAYSPRSHYACKLRDKLSIDLNKMASDMEKKCTR